MEYVKTKNSKWILLFDNDQKINVDKVKDESLIFYPSGKMDIVIQSAVIDDLLINMIKSGRNITELIQIEPCISLEDASEEIVREISHSFMAIKSLLVKGIDRYDYVLEIVLSNY